ncbi:unknown [[Mannheimia] succiniciproducens MBEL55E]|uniref:Uncharacterized protein n=1 Tax=Mannheimia succiniciproducens (strain KCTC 0769BP / MBEL55E) TaxID=221988 RepID=Q65UD7_MANSM|nr:unknown [[Mannheimia] succiniciproducens MBEL55E]
MTALLIGRINQKSAVIFFQIFSRIISPLIEQFS